jgi:hypothetical protein
VGNRLRRPQEIKELGGDAEQSYEQAPPQGGIRPPVGGRWNERVRHGELVYQQVTFLTAEPLEALTMTPDARLRDGVEARYGGLPGRAMRGDFSKWRTRVPRKLRESRGGYRRTGTARGRPDQAELRQGAITVLCVPVTTVRYVTTR